MIAVLIVFHGANKKNRMKTILLILKLLRCCSVVAPLFLRCCSAAVAPSVATQSLLLSHPMSLRCCSDVTPLSLRYRSVVAPLLLCCRFCRSVPAAVTSAVATFSLLLSLLLSLHCHSFFRSAVALVSLWCCSGVARLLFRYQSAIARLLLRYRCCHRCYRSSYRSCCHSTAVAWIFNSHRLKRQNQGNSFHR